MYESETEQRKVVECVLRKANAPPSTNRPSFLAICMRVDDFIFTLFLHKIYKSNFTLLLASIYNDFLNRNIVFHFHSSPHKTSPSFLKSLTLIDVNFFTVHLFT